MFLFWIVWNILSDFNEDELEALNQSGSDDEENEGSDDIDSDDGDDDKSNASGSDDEAQQNGDDSQEQQDIVKDFSFSDDESDWRKTQHLHCFSYFPE